MSEEKEEEVVVGVRGVWCELCPILYPVQGIRHQCKDIFENVIKIYKHLGPGACLDSQAYPFELIPSSFC